MQQGPLSPRRNSQSASVENDLNRRDGCREGSSYEPERGRRREWNLDDRVENSVR